MSKKLRQESITLMNDTNQTWTKILPRTDLKDRFAVIERTTKDHSRKHIVANPERVRVWLQFLFQNHPQFIRIEKDGELRLSDRALAALQAQSELAEVVNDVEYEEDEASSDEETGGEQVTCNVVQPAMESGFSSSDVFTFDRFPQLYLKGTDFLRLNSLDRSKSSRIISSEFRSTTSRPRQRFRTCIHVVRIVLWTSVILSCRSTC